MIWHWTTPEDRLTCDENSRAGRNEAVRVRVVDAAVDRNRRVVAGRIEQGADRADFRLAARDESLAAKTRVNRHQANHIEIFDNIFKHRN